MLNHIFSLIQTINEFLWSGPILILLGTTHILLSIKLKFPQRYVFQGIKLSIKPVPSTLANPKSITTNHNTSNSTMGAFTALATSLAATLGTGNIVGVSTAIAAGGPGALFWCWLTGLLGMATAYSECYLSVVFRKTSTDGTRSGSPMTVIEQGLKNKPLAYFYGFVLGLSGLTAGCTTQSFSISDAACKLWNISPHVIGILLALLTACVILGGAKRIGRFCTSVVPILGFLYIGACLYLLIQNRNYLLPSLELIWSSLFTPKSVTGGLLGGSLLNAARYGIARGLFTNEAGIGTAAIAAGNTNIDSPSTQGLISMTAVFWDTIVMCALTGLVITSNVLRFPNSIEGFSGAGLTSAAFLSFPFGGPTFLTITLIAFAIATLIGWCYIGEKGTNYLFGNKGTRAYELLYIFMIYVGAILPLEYVWGLTDFINALMVFPNVLSLLLLGHILKPPTSKNQNSA